MASVPQLHPGVARTLLKEQGDKAVLLDVREPWEYAQVHVEGARHIPMAQIPERLGELDPKARYVVMCHHGGRSQQVAQFLMDKGFGQVANLAGGIDAWAEALDPNLARY
ncbi:MAG TPA: rhodanese-like domain-containing protein [Gammaproteobacteria bacterium]|jgi:rhodanese-related sulfurtransferase|nr:rhodanese-like domain-containing protein [Gammaproteobacteria bacterium]